MKTAQEVAEGIHRIFFGEVGHSVEPCPDIAFVIKALTAYAEERVKEAIDKSYKGGIIWKDYIEQGAFDLSNATIIEACKKARAEALEEAATIVERGRLWNNSTVAKKIRSLIDGGKRLKGSSGSNKMAI